MSKKSIVACLLAGTMILPFAACGGGEDGEAGLKLTQSATELSLENESVRIVFNKSNGSIREIYNKVSELYLVKDADNVEPITLEGHIAPKENSFRYSVSLDGREEKGFSFEWGFDNGVKAVASATLGAYSDEIVFHTGLSGLSGKTTSVQYPVLDNVGSLTGDGEEDYLVSSMATGYLFKNPAKNFFKYGQGLYGESSIDPKGFASTMQFMGYFTQNKGGFYFSTRDSGDTVKDFTVRGDSGTLDIEIGHYISDLRMNSVEFGYDTVISNLYEGNWYEPAEKYKEWAVKQDWVTKRGLNSERTDLNKDLYEHSIASVFTLPSLGSHSSALAIYEKIRSNLTAEGSKILTIPWYTAIPHVYNHSTELTAVFEANKNDDLYEALERNGEPIAFFEYTDLQTEALMQNNPSFITDYAMRKGNGDIYDINFGSKFQYICASGEQWTQTITSREKDQFVKLGAQGIYNDVGICAVHPIFCYDDSHPHGKRINTLPDFYDLMSRSWEISRSVTVNAAGDNGFTGQEMITEKAIPYVDFFQARSASGEISSMEHDQIMNLVRNDVAVKIPLFEYVYHEYCGIRTDSFLLPMEGVGTAYYHTMAYVALNGGIPEFNFECLNRSAYAGLEDRLEADMIQFIDTLGRARLSYGKDYLVYGTMARAPELGLARKEYYYETENVATWGSVGGLKSGRTQVDQVVVSAYTFGGKTAIFLCNITDAAQEVNFTLNAKELYGKESGNVSVFEGGVAVGSAQALSGGKADISLNLNSRTVYM
nr:hypothetical protein [Clostridiales bacterium]